MLSEKQQDGLDAYVSVLEALSQRTLTDLLTCWEPKVRFVDPFNDVTGADISLKIFSDLFDRMEAVTFKVDRRYVNQTGAVLHWVMTCQTKAGWVLPKVWTIDGVSEIDVSAEGKILQHIDYWDAGSQFYAHLPGIGSLVNLIRRKVSHETLS